MSLFLCNETALTLWRSYYGTALVESRSYAMPDKRSACCQRDVSRYYLPPCISDYSRDSPIHVVGTTGASHYPEQGIAVHRKSRPLPKSSFCKLKKDVYVSSPELCFLEASRRKGVLAAVLLGCEFAGTYRLDPEGAQFDQQILTSRKKLEKYLAQSEGSTGIKTARRAVRFVVDGSASPMETALAMLLCLPNNLGGYGLPLPQMNHEIILDELSRDLGDRATCWGDLVWPERKLIIEYDSDTFHTGASRIANDSKRRNALVNAGYNVITVTKTQIYSVEETEKIAQFAARRLGHRIRITRSDFFDCRSNLRQAVLRDSPSWNMEPWQVRIG